MILSLTGGMIVGLFIVLFIHMLSTATSTEYKELKQLPRSNDYIVPEYYKRAIAYQKYLEEHERRNESQLLKTEQSQKERIPIDFSSISFFENTLNDSDRIEIDDLFQWDKPNNQYHYEMEDSIKSEKLIYMHGYSGLIINDVSRTEQFVIKDIELDPLFDAPFYNASQIEYKMRMQQMEFEMKLKAMEVRASIANINADNQRKKFEIESPSPKFRLSELWEEEYKYNKL